MENETSSQPSLLQRQIPKSVVYGIVGALVLFLVFVYGVIVGLYQAPPWESIKFLVVPDEQEMEESADRAARQTPPATQKTQAAPELPRVLRSNLLNLDIHWLNPNHPIGGLGGGLSSSGDRIIITRQLDGGLWVFDESERRLLQTGVFMPPSNLEATGLPDRPGRVRTFPPRYKNALVGSNEEGEYLLAFYGYNNVEAECRTVRVAMTNLPADWEEPAERPFDLTWTLLFESEPCLSYAPQDPPITGYQEGGFLMREESGDFLFSTGDMGKEGSPSQPRIITQNDPPTDYGRIFRISAETFEVEPVAIGSRNAQGAARDEAGQVWFVDQGPMGGDEVNILEEGANYGWPWVTYGAQYTAIEKDARYWFHTDVLGHHDGYFQPAHVFVPSVAASDITYLDGVHPNWDGDLMIATLLRGALIRLIREDDRILGHEVLPMGIRLRSVLATNGRIYFLADNGILGYLAPRSTEMDSGSGGDALARLNRTGCIECHSNSDIPSLTDVYGKLIAEQRGVAYSDALAGISGKWTRENLTAFLSDPDAFAPGTTMPAPSLSEEEIVEVIEALRTLAKTEAAR